MGAKLWYRSWPAVSLRAARQHKGKCGRLQCARQHIQSLRVPLHACICGTPAGQGHHGTHQISNLTFNSGMVFVRNAAPTVEACARGGRGMGRGPTGVSTRLRYQAVSTGAKSAKITTNSTLKSACALRAPCAAPLTLAPFHVRAIPCYARRRPQERSPGNQRIDPSHI